jgi:hypothetical protein
VIGPIGHQGSEIRSYADDFIQYIVDPVLKELDYQNAQRADRMPEPGRITTQIVRQLKESDLVIADLSHQNPNVYYELSIRHALGKPVIHMALTQTNIPFDLHDNRTIFFTLECRHAENARKELKAQIERVQEETFKPSNPITEAINVIELQASQKPLEQQVASLAVQMEQILASFAAIPSMVRREVANAVLPTARAFPSPIGSIDQMGSSMFPSTLIKSAIFDAETQKREG